MDYQGLSRIIMNQAREKSFGVRPEEILVAEKCTLIHSEISEAYTAYLEQNIDCEDGFREEIGDAFQRTLHLAGIFSVDFANEVPFDTTYISSKAIDGKVARLHKLTSDAWERYRHNELDAFKSGLQTLAYALNQVAVDEGFSLEQAVLAKVQKNKSRSWDKGMNEKFV